MLDISLQIKKAAKVIVTNVYEVSLYHHAKFYIALTHIGVEDVEHVYFPT